MRDVGAPHRRLATARADLKASRELAWTMLVFSLFHAIMVCGEKIVCTVRGGGGGGLDIFQGGLLEPAPQPPCRGRSAAGLHAVLEE